MEVAPYTQAFNRLLKTSSFMEQKVKKLLRPYGITTLQYHILSSLATTYPFPISPKDIKKDLVISSPDVTRILDRLVEKGWVERKTCEYNRRQVDVILKDAGKEKFDCVSSCLKQEIDSYLSKRLSEKDIHHLLSLISKIDRGHHLTKT